MSKLWCKIYTDNRLIGDVTADCGDIDMGEDLVDSIKDAFISSCSVLDVEHPIWLASNRSEFHKRYKTRFTSDNFIQEIDYDYLEIEFIPDKV